MKTTDQFDRLANHLQNASTIEEFRDAKSIAGLAIARLIRERFPGQAIQPYDEFIKRIEGSSGDLIKKDQFARELFDWFAATQSIEGRLNVANPLCESPVKRPKGKLTFLAPNEAKDWKRQRILLAELLRWFGQWIDGASDGRGREAAEVGSNTSLNGKLSLNKFKAIYQDYHASQFCPPKVSHADVAKAFWTRATEPQKTFVRSRVRTTTPVEYLKKLGERISESKILNSYRVAGYLTLKQAYAERISARRNFLKFAREAIGQLYWYDFFVVGVGQR